MMKWKTPLQEAPFLVNFKDSVQHWHVDLSQRNEYAFVFLCIQLKDFTIYHEILEWYTMCETFNDQNIGAVA